MRMPLLPGSRQNQNPARELRLDERRVERQNSQVLCNRLPQGDVFSEASIPWSLQDPPVPLKVSDQEDEMVGYILNGKVQEIEKLIEKGFNLKGSSDSYREHPLVTAVLYGSIETTLLLLKRGADPNVFECKTSALNSYHKCITSVT